MTNPFANPETRWIQTFSGKQYFPLAPRPEDVDIFDIAHHLSMQCRFSGAVRRHYSVAEHSVRVAMACPQPFKLRALHHDDSEAYLVDVPAPIKADLGRYKEIEELNQRAILTALLGTEEAARPQPSEVTHADLVLLATEKRDLLGPEPAPWIPLPEPLREPIVPWKQPIAEWMYLNLHFQLRDEPFTNVLEWLSKNYSEMNFM